MTVKMPGKRLFDIFFSLIGIICFSWLIFISWIAASISTKSNGFFFQKRVGQNGKIFHVIKLKTMRDVSVPVTTITQDSDPRITKMGKFFRKTKIDELPQLFNVLIGDMSFVGPRPDVPGYADKLTGNNRLILAIKPGITGPASIAYKNEEEILSSVDNPQKYNDEVIYPNKIKLNLEYIENWSLISDIKYIVKTVF
ncbi:sugar transferase [Providencia alcalifaciens]|uniref:sugar transferase n=1 Tax=Providencia alcalifaciens TaxID=126385 RepID=UPI001CE09A75|nr:sugar transferase [Providencia alcalifaciens]UBX50300.1 sugar transferase [Providencia alcalifaciens]